MHRKKKKKKEARKEKEFKINYFQFDLKTEENIVPVESLKE